MARGLMLGASMVAMPTRVRRVEWLQPLFEAKVTRRTLWLFGELRAVYLEHQPGDLSYWD